jgi:Zn-dependent protease with chaperone function
MRIAAALPPSVDRSLGENGLKALEASGKLKASRLSDEWQAEVHQAMGRVAPPGMRLRLIVRNSYAFGANALALPDGTIVVTDQMVRLIVGKAGGFSESERAQLAGVLAHEIGHVRMRHGARILAGSSLSAALAGTLFGDFSGVASLPAAFARLSYSREMEAEADEYAIALMKKNGISTLPLARLLERIDSGRPETREEEENGAREWLWEAAGSLLRSHPHPEQRAARLRVAAQQ